MSKPCDALKFSTRSAEEQYWALKPLRQKMQPNELVTKHYEPDVQPQVKLVVNNDERRHNLKYVPPKTRSHQLQNYAHLYNQFDYLGHYCAKRINQIVFMKFNNTKYNLMADAKQRTRVMGGFYVPFHQIFSQNQQLFTNKLGLNFPQNDPDALLPKKQHNRGCSHDPIFSSAAETSNLFAAIRKSPFDYELILQNDVNSCAEISWFNFSVEFTLEGYYTFCIKNMTKDMTKLFKKGFRVSYCFLNNLNETIPNETLDDWNPIGENIKYQQNQIEIEGQPGEYYYDLYFEYRCKNKHQIVSFALDKPYTTLDAHKYFSQTAPKKLRGLTKIEKIQYGRTMSGSALNAYHIRKRRAGSDMNLLTPGQSEELNTFKSRKSINLIPGTPTPLAQIDGGRYRSVFVLTRLSGVDVSGSSIMEGMVDFLLETIDYDMLKRNVNFYFIPMANIDSVKYGNSLTNLSGSNLYDCWRNPHRIYHAEIYHLKNFMQQVNKDSPVSHVFNFTSEHQEVYSSVVGTKNENEDCEDSRIFPFVLSKRHRMFSFEDFFFYEKNSSDSMSCVLTQMFPKVLAYELRISRFELVKQPEDTEAVNVQTAEIKQCRPQSYFNFGRKFMEDYLEHVKIYDKNSLLKDKWLREIQQIQQIKPKMAPNIISQLPVQKRFPESHYSINSLKPAPTKAKVKTPRKFDPYSKSRRGKRSQADTPASVTPSKPAKSLQVKYTFKEFHTATGKQNEKRIQNIDENIRKTLEKVIDKSFTQKPAFPQFRIRERTNQVLKNCSSNLIKFEMGIVSNQRLKKQTNSPYMSVKDRMKKEISSKKLRRIKNDLSFRRPQQDRNFGFLSP